MDNTDLSVAMPGVCVYVMFIDAQSPHRIGVGVWVMRNWVKRDAIHGLNAMKFPACLHSTRTQPPCNRPNIRIILLGFLLDSRLLH